MIGKQVKVIRSLEAPHLVGKTGEIIQADSGWYCVCIDGSYTHFRLRDIDEIASDEGQQS